MVAILKLGLDVVDTALVFSAAEVVVDENTAAALGAGNENGDFFIVVGEACIGSEVSFAADVSSKNAG
jgi:hypothetical protein